MADNEVKIKISLNSDEAIAKFNELREYAERLLGGPLGGSSGGGGSGTASGGGVSQTSQQTASTVSNDKAEKDGKKQGEAIANEMAKVSDRMGRLIGAQIFGAVRRMFADSNELDYLSKLHAGMNTYPLEKQYAQTNAMYGGLFGGAAAGFMLGGPLGAVVGGIGGAAYNYAIAGRKAEEQQRLKEEQVEFATTMRAETGKIDLSRSIGRLALQRQMQLTGSREGQVGVLEDALAQVQFGEGEGSLQNLKNRRDVMLHGNEAYQHAQKVLSGELGDFFTDEEKEDARNNRGKYGGQIAPTHDINSKEAQLLDKQINDAIGTQSELQMQIFQTKYLKKFVTPWEGSDFSDSFTAKGLYAGANVDMEKANEPIVNQLKELNKAMEKFIHGMTDRAVQENDSGPKAVLRAPAIFAP